MTDTAEQFDGTAMFRQIIGALEAHGEPPEPRIDVDTQSLVARYPELEAVHVQTPIIEGPNGPVDARLYTTGAGTAALVWVHGGAFIAGTLDMPEANWVALELAARGVNVLSVDYRKALRGVRYPVPSDDVRAAWRWALQHADLLGVPSRELHLGGASAGAALTAALAKRLRDSGGQLPSSMVLVYPLVHAALPVPTAAAAAAEALLAAEERLDPPVIDFINLNFAGDVAVLTDPHAFAGEGSMEGFPPTYILNAEADSLRASGERFAEQLAAAGVDVEVDFEPGTKHGHLNNPHDGEARASIERIAARLLARTRRS